VSYEHHFVSAISEFIHYKHSHFNQLLWNYGTI